MLGAPETLQKASHQGLIKGNETRSPTTTADSHLLYDCEHTFEPNQSFVENNDCETNPEAAHRVSPEECL